MSSSFLIFIVIYNKLADKEENSLMLNIKSDYKQINMQLWKKRVEKIQLKKTQIKSLIDICSFSFGIYNTALFISPSF